jgi:hypothetical protein
MREELALPSEFGTITVTDTCPNAVDQLVMPRMRKGREARAPEVLRELIPKSRGP